MVTAFWIVAMLLALAWLLVIGGVYSIGWVGYVLLALAIAALVASLATAGRVRT